MNNEEKIISLLLEMKSTLDHHGELLAAQGKRLDSLESRLDAVERRLDSQGDRLTSLEDLVAKQGEMLAEQSKTLAAHSEMLTEQSKTLAAHSEMLAEQSKTLAAHGKLLASQDETIAELYNAVNRVATAHEQTIIPRLNTLDERQRLMMETLASKESVEELKDAMVEWEAANRASFSEVWNRISRLERAK